MRPIFKKTLKLISAAALFAFMAMPVITAGEQPSPAIRGAIFINIKYFGYKFIEFKLQNGNFFKTSEGKVIYGKKDGGYTGKNVDSSDYFKNIYTPERLYYFENEEKLTTILSPYNLEELESLRQEFIKNQGRLAERHFLTGPAIKFKHFRQYAKSFLPNKQFFYAIYYMWHYHQVSALINLNTKEISFPFGLDEPEHIVWDKSGRYLAYSTFKERLRSQNILVLKDISTGSTLFRKDIGKVVSDITWSPDSSAVALLTFTERTSTSWGDSIAAAAGHPYPIRTFYLEVYDLAGNLIFNEQVTGGLKSSEGRLVWILNDQ